MTGFDDSLRPGDDGLFFAGIGAEDIEAEDEPGDEDAILADTKVRPDDETSPDGPTPLLGLGAGVGGAAALGAYTGRTRSEHERSRTGVAGPAATAPYPGATVDDGHRLGVDGYGRIRSEEDPWGVGGADEVPDALPAVTSAPEAQRARAGGGTRGSYLGRDDGPLGASAIPGATLGGIGGLSGTQATTSVVGTGPQPGGIPLSVLANLQNNRATGAAFSPMTGVQASGSQGYLSDPSLVVLQAFGTGSSTTDGVASEEWLREQLREHERGGGVGVPVGVDVRDAERGEDEQPVQPTEPRRDGGRDAAALAGGVVAGAGGWGGGSATSGSAPVASGLGKDPVAPVTPSRTGWGWNPEEGRAPGGSHSADGRGPAGTSTAVPGGAAGEATGPAGSATGIRPGGGGGPAGGGMRRGSAGARPDGVGPAVHGSDFSVSSDELLRDAEQWRRLALEMEGVRAVTRGVADGHSSFGLVREPAAAYSRATHLTQAWADQAARAYEELAGRLRATAAGYDANEQAAADGTGRVFGS